MKFTIMERKIRVSDELQEYAKRKLSKLVPLFRGRGACRPAFFAPDGSSRSWRLRWYITHGLPCRAGHNGQYASVDAVVSLLERQIRKNKTRLEKRLREGAFEREINLEPHEEMMEENYDVIRHKRFSVKPMSVEEAILQMNMLGHQFFVFKNVDEDNAFSVIYHRGAGGYGLIENEE